MKWKIYHKDAVQSELLTIIPFVKVCMISWKRSNRRWQMGPIFLQFPCSPLCPLCPALIVQPSLSSSLTAMCVGAGSNQAVHQVFESLGVWILGSSSLWVFESLSLRVFGSFGLNPPCLHP